MNCECFYVIKEGTIEAARTFADRVKERAASRNEELYPVCISKALKSFYANAGYDHSGWPNQPKVKEGEYLVFVQGKYHAMGKFKGAKRGFPDVSMHEVYDEYFEDLEEIKED